jgi:hypothetical protein
VEGRFWPCVSRVKPRVQGFREQMSGSFLYLTISRYQVMQKCWKEDPAVRPAFKMISQELKKLENTGKVKHKKI